MNARRETLVASYPPQTFSIRSVGGPRTAAEVAAQINAFEELKTCPAALRMAWMAVFELGGRVAADYITALHAPYDGGAR